MYIYIWLIKNIYIQCATYINEVSIFIVGFLILDYTQYGSYNCSGSLI